MKLKKNELLELDNFEIGLELEGGFNSPSDLNRLDLDHDIRQAGLEVDSDYCNTDARFDNYEIKTDNVVHIGELKKHIEAIKEVASKHNFITIPRQTGLHINISRADRPFTNKELLNVYILFYSLQDELFNLVHPDRRYNNCSGHLEETGYDFQVDAINDIINMNVLKQEKLDIIDDLNDKDLNNKLMPLAYHKHDKNRPSHRQCIEFRLFDAKPKNLIKYANLVQKIIQVASNNTTFQVRNFIKKIKESKNSTKKLIHQLDLYNQFKDRV